MSYRHILLIEDDEDDQEIFLTAIKALHTPTECIVLSNAVVALKKLENRQIEADLIFLDLNMPVMNGQQFLQAFRKNEQLNQIPVIVFSTSSHADTIEEAKRMGANDFITKPDQFEVLVRILESRIG